MDYNDLFFEKGDPIQATVGTNGYHSISDYADGFFEGAEFIFYECITRLQNRKTEHFIGDKKRFKITEDIIVYPVCFLIRHSIELYLKEIIGNLFHIYRLKRVKDIKLEKLEHHDINRLWGVIKDSHFRNWILGSEIPREYIFDERVDDFIDFLDKYIIDWGSMDPTGQTFRYPFSNESKRHLENISNISVISLVAKSSKFHNKLKEFRNFTEQLTDEYNRGDFSTYLTYKQLIEISKELPPYSEWGRVDLVPVICELCNKYKLPSKRYLKEKVINGKIKIDYFLSSFIGIDINLKYISKEKLLGFYYFVLSKCDKIMISNEDCELLESFKRQNSLNNDFKEFLSSYSKEELIDIISLMYMGRDNMVSSDYTRMISYNFERFLEKDELLKTILEKKGNLNVYIDNAMRILGKNILWNL